MSKRTRSRRTRYTSGFFARYLRGFVLAKMDSEAWRQQRVAEWVGIPNYTMSEYLNRHTHPSAERRDQLLRLGCDETGLLRAERLDKLEWWMDTQALNGEQMHRCLDEIQEYRSGLEQRRLGIPTRRPTPGCASSQD